jgi:hypothetical protein
MILRCKLDLAYALNAYAAQGVTTRHGIVVIDSTETRLPPPAPWRWL